jgi:hypothetical protein
MQISRAVLSWEAVASSRPSALIADIEPLHVAAYIEALGTRMAKPTVKQHLAAVRMCFDWLVTGGILTSTRPTPSAAPSTSSSAARRPC